MSDDFVRRLPEPWPDIFPIVVGRFRRDLAFIEKTIDTPAAWQPPAEREFHGSAPPLKIGALPPSPVSAPPARCRQP
jgi:hypothetical protein